MILVLCYTFNAGVSPWLVGIIMVLVSLMAGKAEVKYDSEVLNAAAVTQLIEDLGFGAKLIEDNAVAHGKLDLAVSPHMKQLHEE